MSEENTLERVVIGKVMGRICGCCSFELRQWMGRINQCTLNPHVIRSQVVKLLHQFSSDFHKRT